MYTGSKDGEPSHARERRWPADSEINVHSRRSVMRGVSHQKHMRRPSIRALTAIVLFTAGCDSAREEYNMPARQSPKSASSGMTLIALTLNGDSVTPTAKSNVTAQQLEAKLSSINWSQRPVPQVSLSQGGYENLTILAEHAAPDQPIIIWSSGEGGVPTKMKFGPIDPRGPETLKLFLSYLRRDGEYKTMVGWRDQLEWPNDGG